jgi:ketosteroid isomerase-like protein
MKFLTLIFLIISLPSFAQDTFQSLIQSENDFAYLSKSSSTKEAFLSFLDDSSVTFKNGAAVNGREYWQNAVEDSSLLFWWPVAGGVSISGNMGFTTGAFVWYKKRNSSGPDLNGSYVSVWKKNKNGKWKVIADISAGMCDSSDFKVSEINNVSNTDYNPETDSLKSNLFEVDSVYDIKLTKSNLSTNPEMQDDKIRILRKNKLPLLHRGNIPGELMENIRDKMQFKQLSGKVEKENDFGFTYGVVNIISSKKAFEENKMSYLRVWRKSKNNQWKIIIDTVE